MTGPGAMPSLLTQSDRVREAVGTEEAWLMSLNRVQLVLAGSMEETPPTVRVKVPSFRSNLHELSVGTAVLWKRLEYQREEEVID